MEVYDIINDVSIDFWELDKRLDMKWDHKNEEQQNPMIVNMELDKKSA